MTSTEISKNKSIDLIKKYGTHLQSGNVEEILKLYATNAEIIPEKQPSLSNKANIEVFYKKTFQTTKLHGELQIKEVSIFDNIALVRCEEPAQIEILADHSFQKEYFRELFVLTRESEDKDWKILKYMFSQL